MTRRHREQAHSCKGFLENLKIVQAQKNGPKAVFLVG